ncbi:MAG: pentapeptide repeat-containing protein [Desulfovibrionaceae bacterium]|nr:pentapeptide repeat-containing protein [Desulfovibrionaceae bacterium]
MPCCKCKDYGWEASEPVVFTDSSGKGYCEFHSPLENKTINGNEFNTQVFLKIQKDKESGHCKLTGIVYPKDITFFEIGEIPELPSLDLSSSVFHGDADFSKCRFSGDVEIWSAKFKNKLYFKDATVFGGLTISDVEIDDSMEFSRSKFVGMVSLSMISVGSSLVFYYSNLNSQFFIKDVAVKGDVSFVQSKFEDHVAISGFHVSGKYNCFEAEFLKDFMLTDVVVMNLFEFFKLKQRNNSENATILKEANFKRATFHGNVYINSAVFRDNVYFVSTLFMSSVRFTSVRFFSNVQFDDAVIKQNLWIYNEKMTTFPERGCVSFKNLAIGGEARISHTVLANFSFFGYDISRFKFDDCVWRTDKNGNFCIFGAEDGEAIDDLKKYESVYRTLKKRAIDNHDELMASAWHYQEKSIATKLLSEKQCKNLQDKLLWIFLCLYKKCSGYGEDPVKGIVVLMQLVGMIVIFVFGSYIYNVGMQSYEISWSGICSIFETSLKLTLFMDAGIKRIDIFSAGALIFSRVLLPIQAALFALSLRNKLRR